MTDPARSTGEAPLAYLWGDDTFGLDAAVEAFRTDPTRFPSGPPSRWRPMVEGGDAARTLGEIVERVATGSLFGDGTLALVSGVGALTRRGVDRDRLIATLGQVADGNGLAIVEETDSGKKDPPSKTISDAIREAGGVVRRIEAPREGALANWIEARARERRITLAAGAARELATNQGRLAVGELEKLALRRDAGEPISIDDVKALVHEAIPGSMWAFVDAVALRQRTRSLELLERLIEETPGPVLLAVLHRRIRELIEVLDRIERGEAPGALVRSMRLAPFRAETLARQARTWTGPELDAALEGLVELDAQIKGVGGRSSGDARDRLAFDLWIADVVAPA